MHPQKHSTSTGHSVLQLTPEDVQQLLAPSATADAKVGVGAKVANTYARGDFGQREVAIAEQIFRLLVRDTEVMVRAMLAEQLKMSKILPKDIVMTMARDISEVAVPVLQYSEVLEDDDLITLVRTTGDTQKQVAVSERRSVSPALADALIDTGKAEVAGALVGNPGAVLNEKMLKRISDRFSTSPTVMERLGKRSALPLAVAEKVMAHVSTSLAEGLRKKYNLGAEQLAAEETKTREAGVLALLRTHKSEEEVEKLVLQLQVFQRLSPTLIFTALCQGHTYFFECALAHLSGVQLENARRLINDRGDLGFRAVYNKSGLPADMFGAVRLLLYVVHDLKADASIKPGNDMTNRVIEQLRARAEEQPVDNLDYVISLLREGLR